MALHIGQLIRQKLSDLGMSKSEFARRINTTPQNVYGILRRESLDTTLLKKISDVLSYDFFAVIAESEPTFKEPHVRIEQKGERDLLKAYEDCRRELEELKKENHQLLKEINQLLRERSGGRN